MLTNFPHGVSSFGMPIIGAGPVFTTGKVVFVQSVHSLASDSPAAGSLRRPFATIKYALTQLSSGTYDHIIVMPGHVETVVSSNEISIEKSGVSIIGIGSGEIRPRFDFTTDTAASVLVSASGGHNTTFRNLLFTGNVDNLGGPLTVQATDFTMIDCEYRDVTGQAARFLASNSTCDRMWIERYVHRGALVAGATAAMRIIGGDDHTIIPLFIDGNFSTAVFDQQTTAASNLRILGSAAYPAYIRNRNSSDVILSAVATTTGAVGPFLNCRLADNAANITEAFVGADMEFFQPINLVNADGESSLELNITASADA